MSRSRPSPKRNSHRLWIGVSRDLLVRPDSRPWPTPALDQTYLDFQTILGMLEEEPDAVADLMLDRTTARLSSA